MLKERETQFRDEALGESSDGERWREGCHRQDESSSEGLNAWKREGEIRASLGRCSRYCLQEAEDEV